MSTLPSSLPGHWVHSHEEDSGDIEVYRPAAYAFPRSRGRRGFELHADGRLTTHDIGATDKPATAHGRWSSDDSGRRQFQFDDPQQRSQLLTIVSSDNAVLKITRTHA